VVLSEPCLDHQPLVPGEHFLEASAESLPLLAEVLLDDPPRLRRVRMQAYDYVRAELDMRPSVERLATLGDDLSKRAVARSSSITSASGADNPPPPARAAPRPDQAPTPETQALETMGVAVRALGVEMRELRRTVEEVAHRVRTGKDPAVEVYASTPAYEAAEPRVTVIMTVHDYEREVVEALATVAASRYSDLDVLILDDASTDGSADAAASFLEAHPWLPGMLLRHPVNRGLARSRNALLKLARGEYVFILDADNGIYPSALSRLTATLDADAHATFAYSMITVFRNGIPLWLLSGLPWEPERLREGNYIDAMALLRRRHLLEMGGYTIDPRLSGWEDFHLWCRCAESGRYGILVPQVLAWYRRTEHSMLNDTEASTTRAWSLMRARFPDLLRQHPAAVATGPK
jgi:hypothetical protein